MTKEYQEASDVYAAVCYTLFGILIEWLLTSMPPTEGEDEPPLRRQFRAERPGSAGVSGEHPSIPTERV